MREIRLLFRTSSCFLVLLFKCLTSMAQEDARELKVTIIAVSDFDDGSLSERTLDASTVAAVKRLRLYFEKNDSVEPEIFDTKEKTTSKYLRSWLFKDLASDTQRSFHIIFILTHGFANRYPDTTRNMSELFLATSDTYKDQFWGTAIRGSELWEAFHDTTGSSTIFLFLDSCGSGAFDNNNLKAVLAQDQEFASRLLVLASAMPEQSAYQSEFTSALVDIWEAKKACHKGEAEIEKFVSAAVNKPNQEVRLIAPLNPELCIETFAVNQRLALFFNAAHEDIFVTIQTTSTGKPVLPQQRVRARRRAPVYLGQEKYKIIATAADKNSSLKQDIEYVDLVNEPARVQPLFANDAVSKVAAEDAALDYFDKTGMAVAFQKTSALLRTDVSNLASEYEQRRQAADVLEAAEKGHQSARQNLDQAQERLDEAKGERDLCKACPDFGHREDIWKSASDKYNSAEHELSKANHHLRDAERRNQQVTHGTPWDLESVSLQLAELQHHAAERQKRIGLKDKVATELKASLSSHFKIENASRGIVIYPPNHGETDPSLEGDFQSLVTTIKRYNATQVEIEITEPWNTLPSRQEEARLESEKLRDVLVARGLSPGISTIRGIVQMPAPNKPNERSVAIIVSGISSATTNTGTK